VREQKIPQPPTEYDPLPGDVSGANSDAAIFSPGPYQYVKGVVDIVGNAHTNNYKLYRLKYGEGLNPSGWMSIGGDHGNQVDHGVLEKWDTQGLSGLYTIQLSVLDNSDTERVANVQVTVDNEPPSVNLTYPIEGGYASRSDVDAPWITVQADATDNLRMDHIEVFMDGNQIGVSTVAPYSYKIMLSDVGGGLHEIWVAGVDAAGNRAESQHVRVTVTG
jgi:hypothetical protein